MVGRRREMVIKDDEWQRIFLDAVTLLNLACDHPRNAFYWYLTGILVCGHWRNVLTEAFGRYLAHGYECILSDKDRVDTWQTIFGINEQRFKRQRQRICAEYVLEGRIWRQRHEFATETLPILYISAVISRKWSTFSLVKFLKGYCTINIIKQPSLVFELKKNWPDYKRLPLVFYIHFFIRNNLLENLVFTLKFRSYSNIQPSPCTYLISGYCIANKFL